MKHKHESVRHFNNLSLNEKSTLVHSYGKWIWYTDLGCYRISVFEIESEIIEVWYDFHLKSIVKIQMPTYKELDVHLGHINLPLIRTK